MFNTRARRGPAIIINGAYSNQRITGQQRYAVEVASILIERHPERYRIAKPRSKGALTTWLWTLTLPLRLPRGSLLLTMTSRGPAWSRRQAVLVHDLFVINHPEWYTWRYHVSHAIVLRMQIRSAKRLFAVSEPVARQVEHDMRRSGVVVATSAPSPVFSAVGSASAARDLLAQHSLKADSYFLAVGSVDPRKNFAVLVEAWRRLPDQVRNDHPLVFVGARSSSVFRGGVGEGAGAQPLRLEGVDDEGLASLYANCTAVVFPSLDEGFGLPPIEALAAGARVLVSDLPVTRWVCRDHVTYFDGKSPEDLRATLEQTIELGPRSPEQVDAGRQYVASRFTFEKTAAVIDAALAGVHK